jgi:hypothetical protein
MYQNAPTLNKPQSVSITKINWLMFFNKIMAVNSEGHIKPYIAVGKMQRFVILQQVVYIVTTGL